MSLIPFVVEHTKECNYETERKIPRECINSVQRCHISLYNRLKEWLQTKN